jgi:uncharacterized protein (TIGR02145 family)
MVVAISMMSFFLISISGCSKTEKPINESPACHITSPEPGSTFEQGTEITISAIAEDTDGKITEIVLYIDGSRVGSISFPYNFTWDTEGEYSGRHTIKIIATDEEGGLAFDEIEIIITKQGSEWETGIVTDYDGNSYRTIRIGQQWWMAENLKTTHFSDGSEIPLVESSANWANLHYSEKAYCYYDNSQTNAISFGALYTWAAAMNGAVTSEMNPSGIQGICPCEWHLPSDAEWIELEMFLGMSFSEADAFGWRGTDEGDKMKTTSGWVQDGNGTNSSGFSALPAGQRVLGPFIGLGEMSLFWSSTEYVNITYLAFNRTLSYQHSGVGWFRSSHYYGYPKNFGFSVRCIKN